MHRRAVRPRRAAASRKPVSPVRSPGFARRPPAASRRDARQPPPRAGLARCRVGRASRRRFSAGADAKHARCTGRSDPPSPRHGRRRGLRCRQSSPSHVLPRRCCPAPASGSRRAHRRTPRSRRTPVGDRGQVRPRCGPDRLISRCRRRRGQEPAGARPGASRSVLAGGPLLRRAAPPVAPGEPWPPRRRHCSGRLRYRLEAPFSRQPPAVPSARRRAVSLVERGCESQAAGRTPACRPPSGSMT